MFSWLLGDFKAVVAEVETVKTELAAAQELITKLSGGYLTAQSELAMIKLALASAGFKIPAIVAATPEQIQAFEQSVVTDKA